MPSANWVTNKCVSKVVQPIGILKALDDIGGELLIFSKYISWKLKNPDNLDPSEYDIEKPHLPLIQDELNELHSSV